jgi:hypothetical protein
MANVLLIVSRSSPALYAYLRSEFEGLSTEIDVVLDRREGERRRGPSPETPERRRADRRAYLIDNDLRGLGWALVRRNQSSGPRPLTRSSAEPIAEGPAGWRWRESAPAPSPGCPSTS